MIKRTFDATMLNEVINHPAVRPWLAGAEGPLDVSEIVGQAANFALVTEGGGFILIQHEPGIYEVHTQFLPSHRANVVPAMLAAFEYMFTRTNCQMVTSQIPDNNLAAVKLGKTAGFRTMFRREETPRGPTAFVGLSIEEWAMACQALEADGHSFHESLAAYGVPDHADDIAHERAVGATLRMVKAGNLFKGINFYNRWARLAGYIPATVVSEIPPVININQPGMTCVVGLNNGETEVITCLSV